MKYGSASLLERSRASGALDSRRVFRRIVDSDNGRCSRELPNKTRATISEHDNENANKE